MPTLSNFELRKFSTRANGDWKHYPRHGLAFSVLLTLELGMTITIRSKGTMVEKICYDGVNMRLELYPKSPRLGYKMVDDDTERVLARFQTCFALSGEFNEFMKKVSPLIGVIVVSGELSNEPPAVPSALPQNSQIPALSQPSPTPPYYQSPSQGYSPQMAMPPWAYPQAPYPWTCPPGYPAPMMTPPFLQQMDPGMYGNNGYFPMKAIDDGRTKRRQSLSQTSGLDRDFPPNHEDHHELIKFSKQDIDAILDILESSDCLETILPIINLRNFVKLVDKMERIWRV